MRVQFDVCQGPVLGHKVRCDLLRTELERRGHEIVGQDGEVIIIDHPFGNLVSDVTLAQYELKEGKAIKIFMGSMPDAPWPREYTSWHWCPLGNPLLYTLTGKKALILDPTLQEHHRRDHRTGETVVSMGGADTEHITEIIQDAMVRRYGLPVTFVQGPNFDRDLKPRNSDQVIVRDLSREQFLDLLANADRVICGWGTTAFEAYYLGCSVMPIVRDGEQMAEAGIFGEPAFYPMDAWSILRLGGWKGRRSGLNLDGLGLTADWIEMLYHVYGGVE